MFTATFWRAAAERMIRAAAVSFASAAGIGSATLDIRGIPWVAAASIAAGAALGSLLLSLVASQVGSSASPSFVADPAAADKPPATGTRLADRADLEQGLTGNVHKISGTEPRTWTTGGYPGGELEEPPVTGRDLSGD